MLGGQAWVIGLLRPQVGDVPGKFSWDLFLCQDLSDLVHGFHIRFFIPGFRHPYPVIDMDQDDFQHHTHSIAQGIIHVPGPAIFEAAGSGFRQQILGKQHF